jgi:hypothetical protein
VGLSLAHQSMLEKAQRLSSGDQRVGLDDASCNALILATARDLSVHALPVPEGLAEVFNALPPASLRVEGVGSPRDMFERLLAEGPGDADTYFVCLAALHKARLKYQRILETQPVPTMDQVGNRALLQYGSSAVEDLAALLLWRKFLFDLDNRSAQETGYLFEPILAASIGGMSVPAAKSPIRRRERGGGRQVDAIRGQRAYEFKLRMTIAASGQGRWGEELRFPGDAAASGFTPVLIVLDPTPSSKLVQLTTAFRKAEGEVYAGDAAWAHLEEAAGPSMAVFLEKYVRAPIQAMLDAESDFGGALQPIEFSLTPGELRVRIGKHGIITSVRGTPDAELIDEPDALFDDDALGA